MSGRFPCAGSRRAVGRGGGGLSGSGRERPAARAGRVAGPLSRPGARAGRVSRRPGEAAPLDQPAARFVRWQRRRQQIRWPRCRLPGGSRMPTGRLPQLRVAGRDRPRRHGHRLSGAAAESQPHRRAEDDPGRPARDGGRAVPLSDGDRGGGQPGPSAHHADLRGRRPRRAAVLQHEADGGRHAGRAPAAVRRRRAGRGRDC